MAKDDYHVLVYKILSYLYKRLKGKDKLNPEDLNDPPKMVYRSSKSGIYIGFDSV